MKTTHILFVCLGNICRSPTADGVMQKIVQEQGLGEHIIIDSAGTSGWHIGEPPDSRTVRAAATRDYDLSMLRGREVRVDDFDHYDYILAMDSSNLDDLLALKPAHFHGHLGLFLDFSEQTTYREVPDPYHGGSDGFETVLDLVEDACQGLLAHIKASH